MGLFDFLKKSGADINKAEEYLAANPAAILLDVREPGEYAGGHIPGSRNVPVGKIRAGEAELPADKDTPIYVYCQSGGRSRMAAGALKNAGFTAVTDLGGIMMYHGRKVK